MKKLNKTMNLLLGAWLLLTAWALTPAAQAGEDPKAWWREAKFGLFVHWGLYSQPAGQWQGVEVPSLGEWLMMTARIPVAQYATLAQEFNPTQFDAEQWVLTAKRAGMKYVVFTAKHMDGFCLYDSKVTDFDVIDRTPFRRDPLAELARACRQHGLKLGIYYSNEFDLIEPNARGNDWDFKTPLKERNFQKYLDDKVKPQVRELLTQYGPVAILWFDVPFVINKRQSQELLDLVHSIQPGCLVNGRVGNGLGDYVCFGDNEVPGGVVPGDWETCATINDTWGYKTSDHNWKSAKTLLCILTDIVGKGGTYLLNVGPTGAGVIPAPSVERLEEIGRWLQVNGEAIYGAGPSPFAGPFPWGTLTSKPGRLYVHLHEWPRGGAFVLDGLKSPVKKAYLLADPQKRPLEFSQGHHARLKAPTLRVSLPQAAPDPHLSVLALEIEGAPQAEPALLPQPDGRLYLEAYRAALTTAVQGEKKPSAETGIVENWLDKSTRLAWEGRLAQPGEYDVIVLTAAHGWSGFTGGHRLRLTLSGQTLDCELKDQGRLYNLRTVTMQDVASQAGTITLKQAGRLKVTAEALAINPQDPFGLRLRTVLLVPKEQRFMARAPFVAPDPTRKAEMEKYRQQLAQRRAEQAKPAPSKP